MLDSLGHLPLQDDTMSLRSRGVLSGRMLQLNLTHTWGDKWYMGLTGLEVLGAGITTLPDFLNSLLYCPDPTVLIPLRRYATIAPEPDAT